jgi:regulator of nucleoside diphosphate kinase
MFVSEKVISKQSSTRAKTVLITDYDKERLMEMIRDVRELERNGGLQKLEVQLEQAKIVGPREIPEDVVTMNSLIKLRDLDTLKESECWVRFSRESELFNSIIPILSDLGIALLGSREGDTVEWRGPSGKKRSKIVEIVYQPERLGNFEL